MADKEKVGTNGANEEGKTPETGTEPVVVTVQPKKGVGTTIKIVGGLAVAAVFTGLGYFLRGILGAREDDDPATESEQTTDE